MKNVKKKTCFVIGPIGGKRSDIRKKADQLLKHVIAPAVAKCGYAKPVRADNIGEPGIITSQIIDHVINDDLVVADLTGNNPNVFYELAIRHVARKQVVNLVEEGQEIAFDVNQFRAIDYNLADPDSVKNAIEQLRGHIRGGEKQAVIENPISNAIDLLSLRSSKNPIETTLARIQDQVGEIVRAIPIRPARAGELTAGDPLTKRSFEGVVGVGEGVVLQKGMIVRHPTLGLGDVVAASPGSAAIQFESGIKKIMTKYVPLEIIPVTHAGS